MNCLSDQNIQEYIDKELSGEEVAQMDNHLGSCRSCRNKLVKHHQFVNSIINEFNDETANVSIPPFQYPEVKKQSNKIRVRRLFWPAAAAMIIFFLFVYSPKEISYSAVIQEAFIIDIDYEIDANKPWDAQDIIFNISEQALE